MLMAMVTGGDAHRKQPAAADARLRGWKEIAAFLNVDERTVKRWEQGRGLPVRRVPGEARAPVFAYRDELSAWLASRGDPAESATPLPATRPRPRLLLALGVAVVLLAAGLLWLQLRPNPAPLLTADARRLAEVSAMADRLERQPGTVNMRAALAGEAAALIGRVAALPDASPALKREAARAYMRLAAVQDSTNRPSLRDLPAARASLAAGYALIAADRSAAGRQLAGALRIAQAHYSEQARQLPLATRQLADARAVLGRPDAALAVDLALAEAELALWSGRYAQGLQLAAAQIRPLAGPDAQAWLRQLRARDMAAEGDYYLGRMPQAARLYAEALAGAEAGLKRWPDDPQLRWAVGRQQWNLGTTLLELRQVAAALPVLKAARDGWVALAAADRQDEALASWQRTARLAYGEGLSHAGQHDAAIAELAATVADRRAALAGQPGNADRQISLLTGLGALASALGEGKRLAEACAMLGEAADLARRLEQAGALSPQDRDRTLKVQAADRARWCSH